MFDKRANDAIRNNGNTVNGRTAGIAITTHGSDWYFAVCAVMVVATFSFMGLAVTKPRTHRVFHYITASVTMVAAIAYFTMGSNLGFTPIAVEFQRADPKVHGVYREIFYVRYIDWFITTPLLLLDLMLTAAMPSPSILYVLLIDEVMIVTGLVGALVTSSYKWGYFVFGCAALFWIMYLLIWEARRHANAVSVEAGRAFLYCGSLTAFLWLLYPIAWGVCEGGNLISPDSEAVFYGILDLLAKPVFGALLIWGHRNIEPETLGLRIHDYTEKDHFISEKNGVSNGAHPGTNGTNGTSTTASTAPGASTGTTGGVLHGNHHSTTTSGTGTGTGGAINSNHYTSTASGPTLTTANETV